MTRIETMRSSQPQATAPIPTPSCETRIAAWISVRDQPNASCSGLTKAPMV